VERVAFVIANHDYGRWLPDAVESACQDPWPGSKLVVVVDDGSRDGSAASLFAQLEAPVPWRRGDLEGIQGRWPSTGTPVRLFACTNTRGPSAARNLAIRSARAEADYFAILDADDVYRPGKLQACISRLATSGGQAGACYTDYDTLDPDTHVRRRVFKEPFTHARLLEECMVHSACVLPGHALDTIGLYDESLRVCEDYDLWLRIATRFVILHVPEPLMEVRVGGHSSTFTVASDRWQADRQRVLERAWARLRGEP
jgi:glycosyltransferase involved in cell wall biosynthesis